jgi:hypothetical protein
MVIDGVPCVQMRPELGVYLLGAIEPARRPVVESHLAACLDCRAELSALAGLPSLLRRVPADVVRKLGADDPGQVMPEPPLNAPLARIGAIRRRRNLLAAAIAAASAVQALHETTAHPPAAVAPAGTVTVQATNPETGTWAAVRYTPQPWGTELEVSITGVTAGTRCQLMVTGPQGQVISAGGWDFGAGARPVWYPASVPIPAASLRRFTIVADGKTVVTIQAR